MYKYKSSSYFNIIKSNSNYSLRKTKCIQLEKEIFSFINEVRREPTKVFKILQKVNKNANYSRNFETEKILNYIHKLTENNISFPLLIEKEELTKISYELLNYLIYIKKFKGFINYNNLEEEYINLRIRAGPYGKIRGKYYEAIILDTTNLFEIITYIIKDIKGRNVLFNEKIKYIGIACGYFENISEGDNFYFKSNNNKICTIIDMVQDFELNNQQNDYNNDNKIFGKEKYKNNTPETFTKIRTVFIDNNYKNNYKKTNKKENLSFDRKAKTSERPKKYHKFNNNKNMNLNISYDKKILVNKSPLIKKDKKLTNNSSSNLKLSKSNTRNKKLTNNYYNNSNDNKINPIYFSSKHTLKRKKEVPKNNLVLDNNSEKKEFNSTSYSLVKSPRKRLNHKEKMELLKQINKVSRDKSKSNRKDEDENKSASFKTKNIISNDLTFPELLSLENEKKFKEEIKMKIFRNHIKNEIKEEIEKELKEELKTELTNKLLFSKNFMNNNRNYYRNITNLKTPLKTTNIYDTSYDIDENKTITNERINTDINTNINVSLIDIPFSKNNNYDKIMIENLVNLYNNVINKHENNNKSFDNISVNNKNSINIYHKIPIISNNFHYNKKVKNNIFNNNQNQQLKIINKIIKLNNKQNLVKYKSNSPKGRNKISQIPFKKIIVKNDNNKKKNEKIIKIPKNFINHIDNNIIINNKTNNIVYIKQISPNKNINLKGQQI